MKRAYENLLQSYLEMFPCVALVGVRQCGKTTLLDTLPAGWKRFDLERRADFQLVSRDPDTFGQVAVEIEHTSRWERANSGACPIPGRAPSAVGDSHQQ